jgi:ribonuclease HI
MLFNQYKHTFKKKKFAFPIALYEEWNLPDDSFFRYTGPDWALILLSHVSDQMRSKLLFMWWRTWHLRNNMIFGDGKCSIEQSAIFLQSYLHTMLGSREIEVTADPKGKQPMLVQLNANSEKQSKAQNQWTKPPEGWAKLNFDAGFNEQSNSGSWGAVLRNNNGGIILSAWGKINHCKNAEIAEATAGILALQSVIPNYSGPILVENDCATLVSEVKMVEKSKSAIANTVDEIKNLLRLFLDFAFSKVHRSCNEVAHVLARIGRSELGGQVLIGSVPSCVMEFKFRA